MTKVMGGMTMSIDGFVDDMGRLYPDLAQLRDTEMLQESIRDTGAVVMGRYVYELAQGDLTGYEYQTPIFVLTHQVPNTPIKGENENLKIHFATDGVESAVQQAKAAAGNRDVTVVGGADTLQQCLKAGLLDELHVGIMPVLSGKGLRFFEHLENEHIELEKIRIFESPAGRTDLIFRVVKATA